MRPFIVLRLQDITAPEECIDLDLCRIGMAYKLNSRNLAVGVYDGSEGFIGIREKFGRRYLFSEYHWDQGPLFGTACPLEEIEPCPEPLSEENEALFEWLAPTFFHELRSLRIDGNTAIW